MSDVNLLRLSDEVKAKEYENMLNEVKDAGITDLPIWFVHAFNDPVCTSYATTLMYDALKELGAENNKLTLYSDEEMLAGEQWFFHTSWVIAYNTPEMIDWIFTQSK